MKRQTLLLATLISCTAILTSGAISAAGWGASHYNFGYSMQGQKCFGNRHANPAFTTQSDLQLTKEQALSLVSAQLILNANPRLVAGSVKPIKDHHFEVEITTREGSLVQKLIVDSNTGIISNAQ